MQSSDDLICNMKMKRQNYRRTGTCTGGVCVGWNVQNVMWAVTQDMDAELGTNYQERIKNWILNAQARGGELFKNRSFFTRRTTCACLIVKPKI